MDRLREETRDLHERVERRLPVLDADVTLARYRATLAALHALYAPLERRVAAVPGVAAVGLGLARRWRAPLLAADLRALGAPPAVLAREAPDVPEVHDVPAALGALYVLEGATLGGQLIARHVVRVLPVSRADGCAFFAGRGAHVGAAWRAFRRRTTAYAAAHDGAAADAMVHAARRTFQAFDRATAGLR